MIEQKTICFSFYIKNLCSKKQINIAKCLWKHKTPFRNAECNKLSQSIDILMKKDRQNLYCFGEGSRYFQNLKFMNFPFQLLSIDFFFIIFQSFSLKYLAKSSYIVFIFKYIDDLRIFFTVHVRKELYILKCDNL